MRVMCFHSAAVREFLLVRSTLIADHLFSFVMEEIMQVFAFEARDVHRIGGVPAGIAPPEVSLRLQEMRGRLCEFSSYGLRGAASLAFRYVWEAQASGTWPVWVSFEGLPYVEDVERAGIDSASLVVVRPRDLRGALRAAEHVMRSGVCGLVVVDVGKTSQISSGSMGRLLKLAQRTQTACLFLRSRQPRAMSLSPLVSLRVEISCDAQAGLLRSMDPTWMPLEASIVRDKRGGLRGGFSYEVSVSPGLSEASSSFSKTMK